MGDFWDGVSVWEMPWMCRLRVLRPMPRRLAALDWFMFSSFNTCRMTRFVMSSSVPSSETAGGAEGSPSAFFFNTMRTSASVM